jgi:hypothetical protein
LILSLSARKANEMIRLSRETLMEQIFDQYPENDLAPRT